MVSNIQREVIQGIRKHCYGIRTLQGGTMSCVSLMEMQHVKGSIENQGSFNADFSSDAFFTVCLLELYAAITQNCCH